MITGHDIAAIGTLRLNRIGTRRGQAEMRVCADHPRAMEAATLLLRAYRDARLSAAERGET